MKLRDFMLGVVTGLAAAVIIKEVTEKVSPYKSANEILENIKADFKKDSPIDGSWIYMKTENFSNGFTEVPVYRGGISRLKNGEMETYEFAADARTGAVVDLQLVG
ncbi:PepSY domain-containing protein [Lysinibacillus odysseyi]|uniref:Peptidase M4 n=1 Tax=Lysinibacillus odysseyi 34hs-1 = NBRC 100172 TaxID=1220589 RepID=A0A0A3IWK2_9BACI|nr:PepSY domain-containing protein [Lysinibacillus odysseyi]KGR87785.1 peptidase M4 [Lysinibacillus odysseyi 34hs-1 = NBRC 100172]